MAVYGTVGNYFFCSLKYVKSPIDSLNLLCSHIYLTLVICLGIFSANAGRRCSVQIVFDLFILITLDWFILICKLVFSFIQKQSALIWHKSNTCTVSANLRLSVSFLEMPSAHRCNSKMSCFVFVFQQNLTSKSLLETVVRCEIISLPESPRKWTVLLAELVVPAVLERFAVQLTVMCWKDVWLCNRRNLSWTTSTPAYSNYQRKTGIISF